jgi:L-iditol 2-dehydrogenase
MALKLLEREIVQTRPLVTDILPLDRWQEAFAKLERREGMKILLTPIES